MTASPMPQASTGVATAQPARARSLYAQAFADTVGRLGARMGISWILLVATLGVFAPFLASSHPILLKQKDVWSSPMLNHLSWVDVLLVWIYCSAFAAYFYKPRLAVFLAWLGGTVGAFFFFIPVYPVWTRSDAGDWWSPLLYALRHPVALGAGIDIAVLLLLGLFVWGGFTLAGREGGHQRFVFLGVTLFGLLLSPLLLQWISPPKLVDLQRYRDAERAGTVQAVYRTVIPYSPTDRQRAAGGSKQNLSPRPGHWFGTTANSEDVASRMIHASRIATSIGFIATGISLAIGVVVGSLMGYFAGKTDMIGMRLIEIFESIPTLLLLIMLVAFYGRSLYLMMVIIGLLGWTGQARFVRAEFLRLRKQDFVQAAVALGLPLRSILFRHLLPNGLAPLLISTSFGVASAILYEATLSFLGLGLVDDPSWGEMLDQARGVGTSFHWWMAVFPGGAIFLTVFAYNVIGEALRDALDPKMRKRD